MKHEKNQIENIEILNDLTRMSDDGLIQTVKLKAQTERELVLEILDLLGEIELRKLHLKRGYSSLHAFCTGELGYSDSQAYRRISTMRAIKEMPELENKIEEGKLNIAVVAQVQTFFQQQKRFERELQKQEPQNLELLVTQPKLEMQKSFTKEDKLKFFNSLEGKSKREVEREIAAKTETPIQRPEMLRPVSATQTELRMTIGQELVTNLEKLKTHFSHRMKTGSLVELFELLTKDALKKIDGKDTAAKSEVRQSSRAPKVFRDKKPAPGLGHHVNRGLIRDNNPQEKSVRPKSVSNRYISVNLKREVWRKAQGRCAFIDRATGKICESRKFLQIDHIFPKSWGGINTPENLQLLCANHNRFKGGMPLAECESKEVLLRAPPWL